MCSKRVEAKTKTVMARAMVMTVKAVSQRRKVDNCRSIGTKTNSFPLTFMLGEKLHIRALLCNYKALTLMTAEGFTVCKA